MQSCIVGILLTPYRPACCTLVYRSVLHVEFTRVSYSAVASFMEESTCQRPAEQQGLHFMQLWANDALRMFSHWAAYVGLE